MTLTPLYAILFDEDPAPSKQDQAQRTLPGMRINDDNGARLYESIGGKSSKPLGAQPRALVNTSACAQAWGRGGAGGASRLSHIPHAPALAPTASREKALARPWGSAFIFFCRQD